MKKKKKIRPRLLALIMIFLTGWIIWILFTYSIATNFPASLTKIFPLVKFPPPIVVMLAFSAVLILIGAGVGYIVEKFLKKEEK